MKLIANLLLVLITLAYPLIVYFGIQQFEHRYVAAILCLLLAFRYWLAKRHLSGSPDVQQSTHGHNPQIPWLNQTLLVAAVLLATSAIFDINAGIYLYPILVNLVLLAVFGYSLIKKPSIVEVFARMQEPELPQQAVAYTEKVTQVWCLFFIVNASISAYTAYFTSLATWTLYNGLIAYILMALVAGIEYVIRQKVKAKHHG
ncbi:MAG: hypothetical protein ACPG5R_00170 [Cognaticolwellia aestuarii]